MPFPSYNMYFLSFAAQLLILFMALPSQSETRWAAFTTVTKTSYPNPIQMFFHPQSSRLKGTTATIFPSSFACLYRPNREAQVFGATGAEFVKLLRCQDMRKEIKVMTANFCQVLNILLDLFTSSLGIKTSPTAVDN